MYVFDVKSNKYSNSTVKTVNFNHVKCYDYDYFKEISFYSFLELKYGKLIWFCFFKFLFLTKITKFFKGQ
jgi:hypothetical protein